MGKRKETGGNCAMNGRKEEQRGTADVWPDAMDEKTTGHAFFPYPPNPRSPRLKMKIFFNHPWFLFCLRLALGGLFLYAGITKIGNPQAFADSIATFKMLPPQLINIMALGLPPFEVLLGFMLMSGWKARTASLGIAALAIIFAIVLGQAIVRGLSVDCGCLGSGEPSVLKTWLSFARAGGLFLIGTWLYAGNRMKA